MKTNRKKFLVMLFSVLAFFITGCATLQSPAGKAVFNIALRSLAYEAGQKNPGSIGKMVEFATFLSDFNSYLAPGAFGLVLDKKIEESDLDDFHKANVADLASIVKDYYSQLHEKHGDLLTESQALDVIRSIGSAINFGLVPSVDGPAEFVLEGDSLIVVVD